MPDSTSTPLLPVLDYATGAGWQVLGHARSEAGARRVVERVLPSSSRVLIERHGFQLGVARRTALQRELNGGPDGYIWDVYKVTGASPARVRTDA